MLIGNHHRHESKTQIFTLVDDGDLTLPLTSSVFYAKTVVRNLI